MSGGQGSCQNIEISFLSEDGSKFEELRVIDLAQIVYIPACARTFGNKEFVPVLDAKV